MGELYDRLFMRYAEHRRWLAERVARQADFPDLDLRTRTKPPIHDVHYDPRELILLTREQFETLTRTRRGGRSHPASRPRRAVPVGVLATDPTPSATWGTRSRAGG
jgi:hypothetical protein